MEHLALVVCKPSQMGTVFLAGNNFGILALNHIVDLNCFIFACCHNKLALVVEIERCNMGIFVFGKFEPLVE